MTDMLALRLQGAGLISMIRKEAEARGRDPRQLCIALIFKTFEAGIVDAVLDGDDPQEIAPRYGLKAPRGELGPRQKTVLAWAMSRAGEAGGFTCSFREAARELQLHIADVSGVTRSLMRRGDLIVRRHGKNSPSIWTIPPHLTGGASA
ncbi:hypothetical protein [Mycoplana rhizolycopersici]|uniref:DUF3489 domain-containing protein n=1 Tax=Mycoplana rhizolycopersici TaxID=2746702 RepID=A0ABX2QBU9_9HYPH|nr:hypothetical protein [Rhizobium rhizolycopersici]NVP54482.1 hypothetical protein [Rhizobium rhizolycopersici]